MQSYDDTLSHILKNGFWKDNRTGIRTLSVFGHQSRYDISKYFPILTKRKMYYNSIFKELLWIVSGSTNVNDLEAMGSKIWSAWRDKDFEKRNDYDDGDLGPIYGFQLRNFGADYKERYLNKDDKTGFDQLTYVINELKTNRTSRRILFSYWNPYQVTSPACKLSPCHDLFQLDYNAGKLNGMLYQRSADFPIGSPANIQFYSALIYMLCQQCGEDLSPGEFIYSTADTHIYENQIPMIEEYLARPEIDSPVLKLNKAKNMFNYKSEDFTVEGYNPLEKMLIPVAI